VGGLLLQRRLSRSKCQAGVVFSPSCANNPQICRGPRREGCTKSIPRRRFLSPDEGGWRKSAKTRATPCVCLRLRSHVAGRTITLRPLPCSIAISPLALSIALLRLLFSVRTPPPITQSAMGFEFPKGPHVAITEETEDGRPVVRITPGKGCISFWFGERTYDFRHGQLVHMDGEPVAKVVTVPNVSFPHPAPSVSDLQKCSLERIFVKCSAGLDVAHRHPRMGKHCLKFDLHGQAKFVIRRVDGQEQSVVFMGRNALLVEMGGEAVDDFQMGRGCPRVVPPHFWDRADRGLPPLVCYWCGAPPGYECKEQCEQTEGCHRWDFGLLAGLSPVRVDNADAPPAEQICPTGRNVFDHPVMMWCPPSLRFKVAPSSIRGEANAAMDCVPAVADRKLNELVRQVDDCAKEIWDVESVECVDGWRCETCDHALGARLEWWGMTLGDGTSCICKSCFVEDFREARVPEALMNELEEILGRQDVAAQVGSTYVVTDPELFEPDADGVGVLRMGDTFTVDRKGLERFEVARFQLEWGALLCSHRGAGAVGPFQEHPALGDHGPALRMLLRGDLPEGATRAGWVHGRIRESFIGWLPWSCLEPDVQPGPRPGVLDLDRGWRYARSRHFFDHDL
jgi:hypothetical protein